MKTKNFRKRSIADDEDENADLQNNNQPDDAVERKLTLEEIKFLQKQRGRKAGIPAIPPSSKPVAAVAVDGSAGGLARKPNEKSDGDAEKDDLVLQDTFAQETAVLEEDPNMVKYIELELARKRGRRNLEDSDSQGDKDKVKSAEDELYKIPEHLKVRKRNSEESSTQWTTGIAEIQLPIEFKLKNIEETEAAKKMLQEKRMVGKSRNEGGATIPASYSADYLHRGKDYAEKLRRDHPELYKDRRGGVDGNVEGGEGTRGGESGGGGEARRPAATDEFMLARFRKRERHRGMRR